MSVDFEAFLGIGWMLTREQRDQMIDANLALYEKGEVECVEDEFSWIDGYHEDSPVFLGERITTVTPGEFMCVSDLNSIIDAEKWEAFAEKFATIIESCGINITPDSKWANPQLYIVHQIW